MKHRWMLVMVVALSLVFTAQAQAEEQSPVSGSVELIGYQGDFAFWGYAERKVTEKWAVSISAAKYKSGFQEITFGPTFHPTPELQVGISLGAAQYTRSDNSRLAISVFGSLETDNLKAEALFEKYGRDPQPYYRIYAQTPVAPISEKLAVGVHGEQGVGWGPRISWSMNKNIDMWLAAPVIDKTAGNQLIGGLRFSF
jgi:hypothetical protein